VEDNVAFLGLKVFISDIPIRVLAVEMRKSSFLVKAELKKSVFEIRNIDFHFILCQKIKQIFSNLSLSSFHGGSL